MAELTSTDREVMREFISLYKDLPQLWDAKRKDYTNKTKRVEAYETLLLVYKKIKSDASVDDVKKKINILRSNYRKELRKIEESKQSGVTTQTIYEPSSWSFEALKFLQNQDNPKINNLSSNERQNKNTQNGHLEDIKEESTQETPLSVANLHSMSLTKKRKKPQITTENEILPHTSGDLSRIDYECDDEVLVKSWAIKLKRLAKDQKLYAEKAINDILFEAEMGTLNRNSVQINEMSSSANSTVPNPAHIMLSHQIFQTLLGPR